MTSVGIVTGAGRGTGLECARRTVGTVDRLLMVDLDEKTLSTAAEDLSADPHATVVEPHPLDITDRDALAGLASRTRGLGTCAYARAWRHAGLTGAGLSRPGAPRPGKPDSPSGGGESGEAPAGRVHPASVVRGANPATITALVRAAACRSGFASA
ncbi:hypothetical protein [Streptomyces humi]|uniref:hypothetical protein n=1 Tax=Streptomyces humi TaxID=1428620 RepID=UPI0006288B5C|nr:hypothetical protein [Streptomyces humi]